jgi:hypothetical protein
VLDELLSDLAPRFRPQDYNLLFHNCNTFSNQLVQLLTGESLPVRVGLTAALRTSEEAFVGFTFCCKHCNEGSIAPDC